MKFYEIEFKFEIPKSITVWAENGDEALAFAEEKVDQMVVSFLDLFASETEITSNGFNIVTTWNAYPTAKDDSIGIYEAKKEESNG